MFTHSLNTYLEMAVWNFGIAPYIVSANSICLMYLKMPMCKVYISIYSLILIQVTSYTIMQGLISYLTTNQIPDLNIPTTDLVCTTYTCFHFQLSFISITCTMSAASFCSCHIKMTVCPSIIVTSANEKPLLVTPTIGSSIPSVNTHHNHIVTLHRNPVPPIRTYIQDVP